MSTVTRRNRVLAAAAALAVGVLGLAAPSAALADHASSASSSVSASTTNARGSARPSEALVSPIRVIRGSKPRISGVAKVGRTLVAWPGAWYPRTRLVFQWKANGTSLVGEHARRLKLQSAHAGKRITVTVTATKAGYAKKSKTSRQTAKVKRAYVYRPKPAPRPSTSYENCTEARNAGAAPLYRGDPGYSAKLDRDGDGIACE